MISFQVFLEVDQMPKVRRGNNRFVSEGEDSVCLVATGNRCE
jgi:hypothetical protein